MFLSIRKIDNMPFRALKYYLIRGTRYRILKYNFGADEIILDQYLKKNFKLSLRNTCLQIMNNFNYLDSDDKIIIKIPDPNLDFLARLITFGDGKMNGSKILSDCTGYR